jgi:multiple sugar transport system substrate-binding protein
MENWQSSTTDILVGFAGYQLERYAKQGFLEPIDDIWQQQNLGASFPTTKGAVSFNKKIFALPLSYYQWGFFYKKSVFQKYQLSEPVTWKDFLKICEVLKSNNVTPLGLATKENWPVSSWFSYLNLRINGLAFHKQLLSGHASYKDAKVRAVFVEWKDLIDKRYFLTGSEKNEWRGVLPYMYHDQVAMYLMGNFVVTAINIPLSEFGFFRFPRINNRIPEYEEAPTDVLFINRSSPHKDSAKKFIIFMARADNQFFFNEAIGYLSPNINAGKSTNEFTNKGFAVLGKAKGVSQFFNRDTSTKMRDAAYPILGEFARQGDIEKAMQDLENARTKHFNH